MLRCIAIDDEPIALSILSTYCERWGEMELETYSSPRIGMQRIQQWQPDIVFLDIELGGLLGTDLARQLPPSSCLIFTTAYAHYALDGFELNAVDFLHKPFFYDRFSQAMQKAEQWLQMHDLLRRSQSTQRQLMLKVEYRNVIIPLDTILYIESVGNYVKVHNTSGKPILSKVTLSFIESQLPEREFLRIHRSYIIPLNRVEQFSHNSLTLAPTHQELPISKRFATEVAARLSGR